MREVFLSTGHFTPERDAAAAPAPGRAGADEARCSFLTRRYLQCFCARYFKHIFFGPLFSVLRLSFLRLFVTQYFFQPRVTLLHAFTDALQITNSTRIFRRHIAFSPPEMPRHWLMAAALFKIRLSPILLAASMALPPAAIFIAAITPLFSSLRRLCAHVFTLLIISLLSLRHYCRAAFHIIRLPYFIIDISSLIFAAFHLPFRR